ncbi:MAG: cytochrome c oxidase subunit 3 [Spongiibacteraceae bacterium]|jgi:cytochrome c oxidase subunit 3|nr:cytochrome c oxidase subunit 3 [Spongiibacteraceae bacterium]
MAEQTTPGHEPYYVPERSKLAIMAALGLFLSVFGAATFINSNSGKFSDAGGGGWLLTIGIAVFIAVLFSWFRTTIIENRAGMNSAQVRRSYVLGMQWFIFSEVMFFAVFFGSLYYVRVHVGPWLSGAGEKGVTTLLWSGFNFEWPLMQTPQEAVGGVANQMMANNGVFTGPERNLAFPGFKEMFAWLPLWNTVILLSSSFTVHVAHHALKADQRKKFTTWLLITVALGFIFVALQAVEYYEAYHHYGLKLSSGIYGTTFFMLTGFHGVHVIIGATMLLVQLLRTFKGHFTAEDHFGFEAASWYWHFVDVVWVGLFLFVYIL